MASVSWRSQIIFVYVILLPILAVFVLTALPSPGERDNPEFVDTSLTLGIAHPAGFPTFSLMARSFLWLPLGGLSFRVALFSSVLAVLALFVIYMIVSNLAEQIFPGEKKIQPSFWAAAIVVISFGLSFGFWNTATEAEVYSLNLFLLATVFYLGLRWIENDSDVWLFSAAFIYGFASGNHGSVALYLPGFIFLFFSRARQNTLPRFFTCFAFFLIGFSVYLYLPVRASADPGINFGTPETIERFIAHVTDRKDSYSHFAGVSEKNELYLEFLHFILRVVPMYFWLFAFPFVLIGSYFLIQNRFFFFMMLLYISVINYIFFRKWTITPTAFLPGFLCMAIVVGTGYCYFFQKLYARFQGRAAVAARFLTCIAVVTGALFLFNKSFFLSDKSKNHGHFDCFFNEFATTKPDSIIISSYNWFTQRAFQDVFLIRNDLDILLISDFVEPEHFNPITEDRFRDITVRESDFYLPKFLDRIAHFLYSNVVKEKSIYLDPCTITPPFSSNLIPGPGWLFELTSEPVDHRDASEIQTAVQRLIDFLSKENSDTNCQMTVSETTYNLSVISYAQVIFKQGFPQKAADLLNHSIRLFGPQGKNSLDISLYASFQKDLSIFLTEAGFLEDAKAAAILSVFFYPNDANRLLLLADLFFQTKEISKAETIYRLALESSPENAAVHLHVADFFFETGERVRAQYHYGQVLRLDAPQSIKERAKARLKDVDGTS